MFEYVSRCRARKASHLLRISFRDIKNVFAGNVLSGTTVGSRRRFVYLSSPLLLPRCGTSRNKGNQSPGLGFAGVGGRTAEQENYYHSLLPATTNERTPYNRHKTDDTTNNGNNNAICDGEVFRSHRRMRSEMKKVWKINWKKMLRIRSRDAELSHISLTTRTSSGGKLNFTLIYLFMVLTTTNSLCASLQPIFHTFTRRKCEGKRANVKNGTKKPPTILFI